jgi:homoserine kinase
MLSENEEIAKKAEAEMKAVYINLGIDFKTYVSTVSKNGVEVL